MFKRTLTVTLASSFALGMTAFFAPQANAQAKDGTADIKFNGSVDGFCFFNETNNGSLSDNNDDDPTNATELDGTTTVKVVCNTNSELTSGTIDANSEEVPSSGKVVEFSKDGGTNFNKPLALDRGSTEVTVRLTATFDEDLVPAGSYDYTVPLTASPN
ncbi:MAG: hypothetical protein BRC33_06795 [Cyanobacteria bacterium SW_9_44_58]|nr:MAG: hypothetical protein BRC33_06795 [Cyanobacteria bacterium SW_9_44_58]